MIVLAFILTLTAPAVLLALSLWAEIRRNQARKRRRRKGRNLP